MRTTIYPAVLMIAVLLLAGCTATSKTPTNQVNFRITGAAPTNVRETTLEIEGMHCASCALGVEFQLKQVDGVLDANISYEEGKGYVQYDADKTTAKTIAQASDTYPAKVILDTHVVDS